MTKDEARVSAGEKLDRLDATMRRAYPAALAGAAMTAILAACACFAVTEYLGLKWAIADASAKMASGVERMQAGTGGTWTRPVQARRDRARRTNGSSS